MNISIKNKFECCGCTACENICPHNAIQMKADSLGFKYPVVDEKKCTDCGICVKVCSFGKEYDVKQNLDKPICFGARHKNNEELMTSRSGGTFAALSDWIIQEGGVVYGTSFDSEFKVVHKRAVSKEECKNFKGSKYVQSDIDGVFKSVREDLKNGKNVLFSGTPCQIAGLKSYIPNKYKENLYLVDIICHGVPSPKFWSDYLVYTQQKNGGIIQSADFRDKNKFGWRDHNESFKINGKYIYPRTYTYTFYKHIMLRLCCSECPFCNTKRPSDLTLGDFWGWEKTNPKFNKDDKGCSLVLCNTQKGLEMFYAVKNNMDVIETSIEKCMQIHLSEPTKHNINREKFEYDYVHQGFIYVLNKYCKETVNERVRRYLGKAKRFILNKNGR